MLGDDGLLSAKPLVWGLIFIWSGVGLSRKFVIALFTHSVPEYQILLTISCV